LLKLQVDQKAMSFYLILLEKFDQSKYFKLSSDW